MEDTRITARLDEAIIPNTNLIYCATVNLTWNELATYLKGTVTFPEPCSSVDFLNRRSFTKDHLDENCYLAYASTVAEGILERIPKDLREKFNETSRLNLDPNLFSASDIIAYSFLLKVLTFSKKFNEVKGHHFTAYDRLNPVQAFGIKKVDRETDPKMLGQVTVHSYNNEDDFIVSLDTGKDQMVLAQMPPQDTLEKTYDIVVATVEGQPTQDQRLENGESLIVPKLFFDLEHHFEEMICKDLLVDGNPTDYFIRDAVQFIKFSLDEEGAKLRSEMALMAIRCVAMFPQVTPRRFEFEKPFLVYLKEKRELPPYFVAWVANSEIMKKAQVEE